MTVSWLCSRDGIMPCPPDVPSHLALSLEDGAHGTSKYRVPDR